MIDFHDPIWQTIFAIIAILVTIAIFILSRRRKSLSYEIISETSLLTMDQEIQGKVQVIFNGKSIQDVNLIHLQIQNDGNVAILSTDYEKPLRFSLVVSEGEKTGITILSAEIIKTSPNSLNPTIKTQGNSLELAPLLLNGGDTINLKILSTGRHRDIEPFSRIVGIRNVKKKSSLSINTNINKLYDSVIGWIMVIALLITAYGFGKEDTTVLVGLAIFFFTVLVNSLVEQIKNKIEERKESRINQ